MNNDRTPEGADSAMLGSQPERKYPYWLIPIELFVAWGVIAGTVGIARAANNVGIAYGSFLVGLIFLVIVALIRHVPTRLTIDAVAIVYFLAFFYIPEHKADAQRESEEKAGQIRLAIAEQERHVKLANWLENMKATGRHGPPGVVPPMLSVEDNGKTVIVKNQSNQRELVKLYRTRENSSKHGEWEKCPMFPPGSYIELKVNEVVTFELSKQASCKEFVTAPIEYRVGFTYSSTSWWSDSAFSDPEGQKY